MDISSARPEEHYIRKMDEESQKEWIKDIIDRMCEAYELEGRDVKGQLTKRLGLTSVSTVKSWIYNRRIPFHAMVTCQQDVKCSLDWLLTGKLPTLDISKEARQAVKDKLVEHLFNAGRYKLVDSAEGIDITANAMLEEVEHELSLYYREEIRKTG